MATFLDISLLGGAKVVFTFLLVYIIVWGLLVWIKPFGKEMPTGPYAVIALAAAFFSVVSGTVRYLIEFMTPWFLWLVIFIFFTLFVIRMFGVSEKDMRVIIGHGSVHIMIIVIICIILLFGLAGAFGQKSLEATQGATQGGVYYQGSNAYVGAPDTGIGETPSTTGTGGQVAPLTPGQDLNAGSLGTSQPQPGQSGATATSSFSLNAINTLLHPKVMAIIAIILIGTVTVWLLGRPEFI
jgi:hypothetical protein